MKKLSEVINTYAVDVAPDRLPSLLPQVNQELALIRKHGLDTAILASLFEEMDSREARARENSARDHKEANHALDRVAVLEELLGDLRQQINSLQLDKVELQSRMDLLGDGIRDEVEGAYQDGQAFALTVICMRLAGLLNLDGDTLESALVEALDGNVDKAADFLNQLLDGVRSAA